MKEEFDKFSPSEIKTKEVTASIPTNVADHNKVTSRQFSLKSLANGLVTLRDEKVGETFHPVLGPMTEARQLYVAQTFLATCWQEEATKKITVWDVGLGAAANALAVIESWKEGSYGDLVLASFDLSWEALFFALEHVEQHPLALGYLSGWDWEGFQRQGFLEVKRGERKLVWHFHGGNFQETYNKAEVPVPSLIMYDLYSAPKCPSLYSLSHWQGIRRHLGDHDCVVIFHSRSTALRVTLLLAGWFVGKGTFLGEKEETTMAANLLELVSQPLGEEWLGRVRRSVSASPILGSEMKTSPISQEWLRELEELPQWRT